MSGLRGWRERAACARPGIDPDLFFPKPGQSGKVARAKRICARCPVQAPCLADALATRWELDQGIRAGLSERERQRLRPARRRQGSAA